MLEHVDSPRDFIGCTQRCCFLLIGWISGFITRHCCKLIGLPVKNSKVRINHHSISVAAMEPIDITSSDSDLEIEDYRERDTSPIGGSALSNPRVLPSWASMPGTSSSGYGGQSQTVALPKRTSTSTGRPSNSNQYPQPSSSSDDIRSSDRHNGNVALDSQNSDVYGTGDGKYPSQQALKRSLPSSLQPYVPTIKSNTIVENVGSSQIRDSYGKLYHSEGSSLSNGKRYSSSGNDDDVIMYENGRSRILPPSLTHGKSFSSTQFASSSDHVYRSGLGEERDAENDERLIYQAALQGLGKTISMIALIQMQRSLQSKFNSEDISNHKTEALNLDDDDDNGNGGLEKVEPSWWGHCNSPNSRRSQISIHGVEQSRPSLQLWVHTALGVSLLPFGLYRKKDG